MKIVRREASIGAGSASFSIGGRGRLLVWAAIVTTMTTMSLSCGPVPCPLVPPTHRIALEIRVPDAKGGEELQFTLTLGKEKIACNGSWLCGGDMSCDSSPGLETRCPGQGGAATRSFTWGTGERATGPLVVNAQSGSTSLRVTVLEDKLRLDFRHGEHCEADTTRAIVLRFDR